MSNGRGPFILLLVSSEKEMLKKVDNSDRHERSWMSEPQYAGAFAFERDAGINIKCMLPSKLDMKYLCASTCPFFLFIEFATETDALTFVIFRIKWSLFLSLL